METPKNGVARSMAGTIPINVLIKAVAVRAVIISLIFSGATKQEIQNTNIDDMIEGLQLLNILSPNRRNGTYNMFGKIKQYAK